MRSSLSRKASRPPCTAGCRVLTRPSIISGKTGDVSHVAHGQPGFAQRLGGAAGRQQFDPAPTAPAQSRSVPSCRTRKSARALQRNAVRSSVWPRPGSRVRPSPSARNAPRSSRSGSARPTAGNDNLSRAGRAPPMRAVQQAGCLKPGLPDAIMAENAMSRHWAAQMHVLTLHPGVDFRVQVKDVPKGQARPRGGSVQNLGAGIQRGQRILAAQSIGRRRPATIRADASARGWPASHHGPTADARVRANGRAEIGRGQVAQFIAIAGPDQLRTLGPLDCRSSGNPLAVGVQKRWSPAGRAPNGRA